MVYLYFFLKIEILVRTSKFLQGPHLYKKNSKISGYKYIDIYSVLSISKYFTIPSDNCCEGNISIKNQ